MFAWNLLSSFSAAVFGPMETPDPAKMIYDSERYAPSVEDVLAVKQILITKGSLPLELTDSIIDFAEYWIRTTTHRLGEEITITSGRERENRLLLRSYPLGYIPTKDNPTTLDTATTEEYPAIPPVPWSKPDEDVPNDATQEVIDLWTKASLSRGEFPCRKIRFTIKSHDQGWGGPPGVRGTYKGSSTWFDVGLEKVHAFRESQLPSPTPINFQGAPVNQDVPPTTDAEEAVGASHESGMLPYFEIPDQSAEHSGTIICCTRTVNPATVPRDIEGPNSSGPRLSFRHALNPGLDCLQRNRTATRELTEHQIIWSCTDSTDPDSVDGKTLDDEGRGRATGNGDYVRNLKVGDVVTVWGKSRYGGWNNNVAEVKIDMYWVV